MQTNKKHAQNKTQTANLHCALKAIYEKNLYRA